MNRINAGIAETDAKKNLQENKETILHSSGYIVLAHHELSGNSIRLSALSSPSPRRISSH